MFFGLNLLIAVARWDGIELPSSQIPASNDVERNSIGYIPDEW